MKAFNRIITSLGEDYEGYLEVRNVKKERNDKKVQLTKLLSQLKTKKNSEIKK